MTILACAIVTSPLSSQSQGKFAAPVYFTRAGISQPVQHDARATRDLPSLPDSVRQSHWKEGEEAGVGLAGVIALLFASSYKTNVPGDKLKSSLAVFVEGSLVFGVIGGLIGSGFHKN